MRTQEQAFRTYYASMSDADLLQRAAHEDAFIAVARNLLEEELRKRKLSPPRPPISPPRPSALWNWGHHLMERFHHAHPPVSN